MSLNASVDKEKPGFWQSLKPGDFITLKDADTMLQSQKRGNGFAPVEYEIESVIVLEELTGLAEWRAISLKDNDKLWLWIKIVDENVDVKIGWENKPEDYMPGNRQDMVERDWSWLFTEESIVDFEKSANVNDLIYSRFIQVPREKEDGQVTDFVFLKKGNLEFEAHCNQIPKLSGMKPLLGTIAEYNGPATDCSDPELIIFEIGAEESDSDCPTGGLIRILNARNISILEDIEILSKTITQTTTAVTNPKKGFWQRLKEGLLLLWQKICGKQ